MEVRTPTDQAELIRIFSPNEDDEVKPIGDVPTRITERLAELSRIEPNATVTLARDWEDCIFGLVEGSSKFDVLSFSVDGRVGHGGINQPVLFDTFAELITDDETRRAEQQRGAAVLAQDSIEDRIEHVAVQQLEDGGAPIWTALAQAFPEITTGDDPGHSAALSEAFREQARRWIEINMPRAEDRAFEALRRQGRRADVVHTGGGCMAVEIELPDGIGRILVTDGEDAHEGSGPAPRYALGVYRYSADGESDEGDVVPVADDDELRRRVDEVFQRVARGELTQRAPEPPEDRYWLTDAVLTTYVQRIVAIRENVADDGGEAVESIELRPATADDRYSMITVGEIVWNLVVSGWSHGKSYTIIEAIGESGKSYGRQVEAS